MPKGADTRELEAVYRARYADFLRIARSVTRDDALARDAVQETFARAIRLRESYRGEGDLEGWVWSILVNVSRTLRGRVVPLPLPLDDAVQAGSHEPAEHSEFRSWVAALPERQRLVVFLRYWADLDYRTIAAAVGVEVGTVSATLNAAHAAIRRSLEEVS
ncbi:MAG: RNA polymerase sigma factor [Gaiellaceae bacterium]